MRRLLYIILFLIISTDYYSQVFTGTTSGQFLKIEPGARAIAMGGAFVSVANDASALYWNPSGLPKIKNNAVVFSHTYWLAGTNHDYAGLVYKLNESHAFGISYTLLSIPDMKVRTEIYQDGTGEYFSASDFAIGLSYGFMFTEEFSLGITGKYISQNIWHMTASTFAIDIGLHYNTPFEGLSLGMCMSNIGPKIKYEGDNNFIYYSFDPDLHGNSDNVFADIKMDSWDLPLIFRVGLAYELLNTESHDILITADAVHPNDYSEYINTGFEYCFMDRIFLRGGYKALFKKDSEEGLTLGTGVIYYLTDYLPLKIDYSYSDFGRLKDIHRFSVEVGF